MKKCITLLFLVFSIGVYSQEKEINFSDLNKKQIIDSLYKKLEEYYIQPKANAAINKKLNENLKKGFIKTF